jgi:hypothetical protein
VGRQGFFYFEIAKSEAREEDFAALLRRDAAGRGLPRYVLASPRRWHAAMIRCTRCLTSPMPA